MKLRIATSVATAVVMALGISACQPKHGARHRLTHAQIVAHHWRDGRYAYQDQSGTWWLYVYADGSQSRTGGSLSDAGSWARGTTPLDLDDSVEVEATVTVVDGGSSPLSDSQATAEAQAEAGGGGSEASAGPSDASPSVGGGGESGGGGGDSGGGGGDGGGGSGD
jgi:hypothetical protein